MERKPAAPSAAAASAGGSVFFTVPTANNIIFFNAGVTTGTARATHTINATDIPLNGNATIVFTDTGAYQINGCN